MFFIYLKVLKKGYYDVSYEIYVL